MTKNMINPNTTLLRLVSLGYSIYTPDAEYSIERIGTSHTIALFHTASEETVGEYPLTIEGLTQALAQMKGGERQ